MDSKGVGQNSVSGGDRGHRAARDRPSSADGTRVTIGVNQELKDIDCVNAPEAEGVSPTEREGTDIGDGGRCMSDGVTGYQDRQ